MGPLTALILDWLITAAWPIVGRAGVERYHPILFAQAGLLVGLLALAPWLCRKGRLERILSRELRWPLFLMALFGSCLSTCLFITAVQYTTPANAAITAQIEVLYSALLCAWLLGERITWPQSCGSVLVVAGTALIMAHDLSSPRWKGDLIILLTPWMFQVSHIFAKRLPKDLDALAIAGARAFYGALAMLPLSAWVLWRGGRWEWSAAGCGLILAQGVGLSSLNLILWYLAIRRMDLAKATAIMLSYPALTVLYSWTLGAEKIGRPQLAGLLLTLSGAYWVSLLVVKSRRADHAVGPA